MSTPAAAIFFKIANAAVWLRHPVLVGKYLRRFRRLPNVCSPHDQTERMLWRKIFDRNPVYRLMQDKLAVRAYVRAHCPDLPLSEIVWLGTEAGAIPDSLLRDGYVVKANNGSDRNIFPTATTTRAEVETKVGRWMREAYGVNRGEWAYGTIQPVVFVEKRLVPPAGEALVEINCQVAMGRCFLVSALQNAKTSNVRRALFDRAGTRLPFGGADPSRPRPMRDLSLDFRLPAAFPDLVRCAETLARDCDYVRVDFLCAGDSFQFGEFTIFHSSGYDPFPEPVERVFATNWDLRRSWFMQQCWRGPLGWYAAAYRAHLDAESAHDTP